MNYRVRAQRMEYADLIVTLPDDQEPTMESIQQVLNTPEGEYFKLNMSEHQRWLPTEVTEMPKPIEDSGE